jgi:hypothetical protein
LVAELGQRFNIFWDKGLPLGQDWRQGLAHGLHQARCVLALWTKNLRDSSFVTSEVERAVRRGVLLPVKLDPDANIPLGFDRFQHLDISAWPGKGARGLSLLFKHIQSFMTLPLPKFGASRALPESEWVLSQSSSAIADMRQLADRVSTLGGVLVSNDGPVGDVKGTLNEIHATCIATSEAIDRFLEPAKGPKRGLLKSYLKISGGELSRFVDEKRGHCSRIFELYGRAGGLRDWLTERAKPDLIEEADGAFGRLASADGDLFATLSQIGEVLGDESTDIVALLMGGQDRLARDRIKDAQLKLLPLRRELSALTARLQRIEAGMGFVPKKPKSGLVRATVARKR